VVSTQSTTRYNDGFFFFFFFEFVQMSLQDSLFIPKNEMRECSRETQQTAPVDAASIERNN
jgi:hypothetical protein